MTGQRHNSGAHAMADIRRGMAVRDRRGEEIGTVKEMRMGDPEAVTSAGQETGEEPPGILTHVAEAFRSEDELPEQFAEKARRIGYLRVSRTMSPVDIYVLADQLGEVADETVHLTAEWDELFAT